MELPPLSLAAIATAGGVALGWLWRAAKRRLRLSMDLRLHIRTNDDGG